MLLLNPTSLSSHRGPTRRFFEVLEGPGNPEPISELLGLGSSFRLKIALDEASLQPSGAA